MPSNELLFKSNKVSLERLPIAEGINPPKRFPLRLSLVRLGREAKSKPVRVPVRLASEKFISETVVLVLSQTMASQLQRLPRFVRPGACGMTWWRRVGFRMHLVIMC